MPKSRVYIKFSHTWWDITGIDMPTHIGTCYKETRVVLRASNMWPNCKQAGETFQTV